MQPQPVSIKSDNLGHERHIGGLDGLVWTATNDSVRADLARMPDMSPAELRAMMPDHHRRMMRLMEAHQAMMKNMRM